MARAPSAIRCRPSADTNSPSRCWRRAWSISPRTWTFRRWRRRRKGWARGCTGRCRRANSCAGSASRSARRRSRQPRRPTMPARSMRRSRVSPARIAPAWAACSRPSPWPTRSSTSCPASKRERSPDDAGKKFTPGASPAWHNGNDAPGRIPERPRPCPPRLLHPRRRRVRRRLCEPQRRAGLRRRARQGGGEPRADGGGARRSAGPPAHRLPGPFARRGDDRPAVAAARAAPRRCDRDRRAGARHRRHHRRLRPRAVRRRNGRRHRGRPCRLARRRHRRPRSDDRGHGAVRRRPRARCGRARADHPPAELRGRPRIRRPLQGRGWSKRTILPALGDAAARPVRSSRLYRRPPRRRRRPPGRGPRPLHLCRCNAVLQLPPLHPPQRARLRAPHQRHRARSLAAISRISVPPCPFRARVGDGNPTAGCGRVRFRQISGVTKPRQAGVWLGRGAHRVRGPTPESPESTGTKPRPACPSYCQPCRLLVIRARGRGASRQEPAMRPNNGAIKIVAGNSNPALADAIAAYLATPLTKAGVRRFADMGIFVETQETVRGTDVFFIQSTSFPANDNLMELLIIIDALRRASGRRVTAVIPYFGYARQDRKPAPRTPISAKLVSNLITRAGADRVMTLDLHAGQIQGFFDIPTDNLYAAPMMVRDIKERFDIGKVMVVSPDVGGVGRARGLAKRINAPLAIVDKRRERAGESEVMNVIGEVDGYICILVDDIIDSGGTVVNAADALLEKGATEVYAYITHGVLSGGAVARITASRLKELVITDSIQPTQAVKVARNIRTLSVASLIGEAIGRTAAEESVSSLFD